MVYGKSGEEKRMKLSKGEKTYKIICFVVTLIITISCLYPLLYCFFLSFATAKEIADNGGYLLWFPTKPTLLAYRKILNSDTFVLGAIGVSVVRTLISTALHLTVCTLAGYALSRRGLPGKAIYMRFMLVTILFGGGLIPSYLVMTELGFYNSFLVLILPGIFSAYNVLIFKQFFEGIPLEMEEAAQVDGVNDIQLFSRIILPMSKPVLAAIGLFTVVGNWNDWFTAFLYIDQEHSNLWPLQTYIMLIFNNLNMLINPELAAMLDSVTTTESVNDLSTRMALTFVAILPMLIIYPFFQKYFTKGVYLGAVKG